MIQLVKRIARLLLTMLALGIFTGIVTAAPDKAHAAPPAAAAVGVVDFGLLVNQHPDTPKANETLKTETEAANKEFEAKAAGLSDADKQNLKLQLMQRVEQKRQELLNAIADKINAVVKQVADARGLATVLPKGIVVCGGVDITDEVLQKIRQ